MNPIFKDIYARQNFVVLDTETTGLHAPCEIIDISIRDCRGELLMDTLIKPKVPIDDFITSLTGITNEMVQDSIDWPTAKEWVMRYIAGRDVITYNAKFDRHMMHCSDEMWGLATTDYKQFSQWHCAMEAYAPLHGDFNEYYGSWKWAKLTVAVAEQGLTVENAHRADGDVRMTLALLDKLCKP